jgi:Uma2 family endonuclease
MIGETVRTTVEAPVLLRDKMTAEEFFHMCHEDTKANLIDGVMIMESPASYAHERLFRFLFTLLTVYVRRYTLGQVLGSRTAVQLEEGHVYEPDLLFIRREREDIIGEKQVDGAPDLVVEIFSASTYHYDTGVKREGYERNGVRELWLLDPYGQEGTQMLIRDEATGKFRSVPFKDGVYHSVVLPGLWLRAEWLWPGEGKSHPDVIEVLGKLSVV